MQEDKMSNNELYIKQMSDRGGVTLPPEIRKHLELNGGEHISFKITKSGSVEIAKVEIREINPKIKAKIIEKSK